MQEDNSILDIEKFIESSISGSDDNRDVHEILIELSSIVGMSLRALMLLFLAPARPVGDIVGGEVGADRGVLCGRWRWIRERISQ